AELLREQVDGGKSVNGGIDDLDLAPARLLQSRRQQRWKVARLMRRAGADGVRIAQREVDDVVAVGHRSMSASALQTSIFVRTRRITSSVSSIVDAWPPRSAVRTPSDTASSADSYMARDATRAV